MAVRKEMVRACARLVKRSVFDGHACDFNLLASKFYILLTDENIEYVIVFLIFSRKKKLFKKKKELSEFYFLLIERIS